jgi:hypothetical protein
MQFLLYGRLLAFGVPGGAIVARLDPTELKNYLCSQPGTNLTPAEWSQYVGDASFAPTCRSWK